MGFELDRTTTSDGFRVTACLDQNNTPPKRHSHSTTASSHDQNSITTTANCIFPSDSSSSNTRLSLFLKKDPESSHWLAQLAGQRALMHGNLDWPRALMTTIWHRF
jgi:hypothetical protein